MINVAYHTEVFRKIRKNDLMGTLTILSMKKSIRSQNYFFKKENYLLREDHYGRFLEDETF